MSKPISRIVFSVLIALVLVAGIYTSVQGAMLHTGIMSGQAHANLSLRPNRISANELNSFGASTDTYQHGHDCNSDSSVDPDG